MKKLVELRDELQKKLQSLKNIPVCTEYEQGNVAGIRFVLTEVIENINDILSEKGEL